MTFPCVMCMSVGRTSPPSPCRGEGGGVQPFLWEGEGRGVLILPFLWSVSEAPMGRPGAVGTWWSPLLSECIY